MENLTIYKDIMDSLSAQIAILDETGDILETNRSWQEFGEANGLQPPGNSLGQNYLEVCVRAADETSELAATGIRRVLAAELQEFNMQYPCHSPTEERWFVMRAVKLRSAGKRKAVVSHENITPVVKAQQELQNNEKVLRQQKKMLEDSNTALNVLLQNLEQERIRMEENILVNVRELVLPILDKMRLQRMDERNRNLIEIITSRLNEITSPFLNRLTSMHRLFTPREIEVAVLVREGKSSKEIAELLAISPSGVDFHRKKIRQKIGLTNEKSNLRSYLLTLQ